MSVGAELSDDSRPETRPEDANLAESNATQEGVHKPTVDLDTPAKQSLLGSPANGGDPLGRIAIVEIASMANGGAAIARIDGRAVFVRHAIPGEKVRIRITAGKPQDRYWRADAIEVLRAAPERVSPHCDYARPDGCGGCDYAHIALPAQRRYKAQIVQELLERSLGECPPLQVESLEETGAAAEPGLRWRTRATLAVVDGQAGFRAHRSQSVVPIADCPVTVPGLIPADAPAQAAALGEGRLVCAAVGAERFAWRYPTQGRPPRHHCVVTEVVPVAAATYEFAVSGDGFWQAHRQAPARFVEAVLQAAQLQPHMHVLDLYAGVGLFSLPLADSLDQRTGGALIAVEGDRRAARLARKNALSWPQVSTLQGDVRRVLMSSRVQGFAPQVVVLDPPRTGAKAVVPVLADLVGERIVYVSCDAASFARDAQILAKRGWKLQSLRAFDAFPHTHHVETLGVFSRS